MFIAPLPYSCLFSITVALLLSASSINQEEADRLVEEVTAEVKSEESTKSSNKTSTTKSTTTTKKTSNAKDSTSKPISNAKFNGRTVTVTVPKKTTTSSRPTVPGRSPVTGRKYPSVVSVKTIDSNAKGIQIENAVFDATQPAFFGSSTAKCFKENIWTLSNIPACPAYISWQAKDCGLQTWRI